MKSRFVPRSVAVALFAFLTVALTAGLGTSVASPKQQAAQQRGVVPSSSKKSPNGASNTGPYYALLIGIQNYRSLPKLSTPVKDAEAIAAILSQQYGFQTRLLKDATRDDITHALNEYRRTLDENANLLVYYAGHGSFDKEADKAYWLPVNAELHDTTDWILADDITTDVKVIPARHILLISDSCYSGGITRDISPGFTPTELNRYVEKMEVSKSRTLMSSGGVEPVADEGGAGHSVFAAALIRGLSSMEDKSFSAEMLFERYVRVSVAGKSEQTPTYSPIRNSGHDSGDFVFTRMGPAPKMTLAKNDDRVRKSDDRGPTQEVAPAQPASRQPAAPPTAPAPAANPPAAQLGPSIVGCWLWFNNTRAVARSDGSFVDGTFNARWVLANPAQQIFTITWPKSVDRVTLSADLQHMNGGNQYGFALSATRTAWSKLGPMGGIAGTWLWANGVSVTLDPNGSVVPAGSPLRAHWNLVDAAQRIYTIVWPEPVDTLTLSPDTLRLTGGNQYGVTTGGSKTAPCPGVF
ncbi:MAG: caspase family protein [Candidatus Acidiferrales bacterium]